MGLFSRHEETLVIDSDNIAIDPEVSAILPDPGEFLVELLSPLHEESLHQLSKEIDRVRHPNGSIPRHRLREIGLRDWKSGPLTHLVWFTAKDTIIIGVWASYGLSGREKRRIERTVSVINTEQGTAAAATWARLSRPSYPPRTEFLAAQLADSWNESAGQIRNGDVIKSFRKWHR
ncbi:hypothetical protein ACWGE0_34975 [Lentzea sp. NPDC054927]